MSQARLAKLSLIAATLLLSGGILWLRAVPSNWHASIYRHAPTPLLGLLALTAIATIISILWIGARGDTFTTVAMVAPLVSAVILFYSIPTLLGYRGQIGDITVHVSAVSTIISQGTIPDTSYLVTYIIAGMISHTAGFSAPEGLNVLAVASFVVFALICAAHARRLGFSAIGTILFIPVAAAISPLPASLAYQTVFVFGVYFLVVITTVERRQDITRFRYLIIFPVLIISITHPLTAINFIGYAAVVAWLAVVLLRLHRVTWVNHEMARTGIPVAAGAGSVWVWIAYGRPRLVGKTGSIISAAFLNTQRPEVASKATVTNTLFDQFGFSFIDFIWLGIRLYGDKMVLIGTAGLVLLAAAILAHQGVTTSLSAYHWVLITLPPLMTIIEFLPNALPGIQFLRLLRPSVYLTPVVAAGVVTGCWSYLRRVDGWRAVVAIILVSGLITGSVLLGAANHYDDPEYTLSVNDHRSAAEIAGYQWFFKNKKRSITTRAVWRLPTRVAGDLLSEQELRARSEGLMASPRNARVPPHFGNSSLGNETENIYVTSGTRDHVMLLNVLRRTDRLTRQDLARLQADPTVVQIYANGNINISLVNSNQADNK